jgi:hypothetical protein
MIDRNLVEIYTGDRDDAEELPRATEKLTGGMRAEDIFGRCPAYELDGLEEVRREFRARERSKEPKI